MTLVACLLMNFAFVEARIYCILLIVLSPCSSILLVLVLKSSYNESSATIIAILSQMS